jgi:hypothetical protein
MKPGKAAAPEASVREVRSSEKPREWRRKRTTRVLSLETPTLGKLGIRENCGRWTAS